MPPHYRHLSDGVYLLAFLAGLISSLLSMLGSSLIISNILRQRKYRDSMFHRIMLGLSTADFLCTFAVILQPFMVPTYTNLLFAKGSDATCNGVGVLMMFMIASYLYSCELCIYFLLVVRHGAKMQRSLSDSLELWMHIWPWLVTLALSIIAVRAKAFTPSPVLGACWLGCTYTEARDDCLPHESDYASVPFTAVAFLSFFTGIICTCLVYWSVRRKIRQSQHHVFRPSNQEFKSSIQGICPPPQRNKKLESVSHQALCYTGAFANSFLVILFGLIVSFWDVREGDVDRPLFVVTLLLVYSLYPLQGWINFLIYSRPSLMRWKEANPDRSHFWAMRQVMMGRSTSKATTSSIGMTISRPRTQNLNRGESETN